MEGSGLGALTLGETHVKEEPESAVTDHVIKEEAELLDDEEDCVKEESSYEDSACPHEVSEAAALAGLYLDHVVKDELVLGPEDLHRMNIGHLLHAKEEGRGTTRETHTTYVEGKSDEAEIYTEVDYDREPVCDICGRRFTLKSDLMKHVIIHIDILTSTEKEDSLLSDGENDRATRAQPDRDSHTEHDIYDTGDYDREPICDICGSRFALKSDLMKHVVIHIHTPANVEQGEGRHDVADASNHALNTAAGCGQAVACARSSRYTLRDCCVRLERIPALEHRAPPPHTPPPHSPHKINNIPHDNAGIETYICETCSKIFQLNQDLIRHCQRCQKRKRSSPKKTVKFDNRPYSCVCGKQFKYKGPLEIHNRIHTGETPYSCEICDMQFAYSTSLLIHKRLHTGEKPYACKICLKRFRQSNDLKNHSRTHTGEKPYYCSTCKKQFSTWGGFNTHTLNHKGEYPYQCEVCEKRFSTSSGLKVHNKRTHEGFSCKICNEHFTSVESFRIHIRSIHNTGGPVYTCNVCKKKYTNSFNYKQHKLIHTGEKPHSCKTCGKRFTRLAHLKSHTRYHTGDKRFSCDACGERFVEKYTLICHERAQHTGDKPYSCDICQKRFRQKTHLNVHKRVHTGEKPYACAICYKRFTTSCGVQSHNRIHTGETPYSCEICGKRFKHSCNFKRHKRTHSKDAP